MEALVFTEPRVLVINKTGDSENTKETKTHAKIK